MKKEIFLILLFNFYIFILYADMQMDRKIHICNLCVY